MCLGSKREPSHVLGEPAILGVFVACWHILDSLAWCGAASPTLCGGRGDPHPSWRSSLVESGIRVTGELSVSLGGLAFVASQGVPGRDLVVGKRYSC